MKVEMLYRPSFSMVQVDLDGNERITVESDSMVAMSSDIHVETKMKGGLLKSLVRFVLNCNSYFFNTFQADRGHDELDLSDPQISNQTDHDH